jgi:hypothetical protein
MASPTVAKVERNTEQYGTLGWLKADAAYREKQQRLAAALKGW